MTAFSIQTQNDIKKGLGMNIFNLTQTYNYSKSFIMKARFTFKEKERQLGFDFIKFFFDRKLYAHLNIAVDLGKGMIIPNLNMQTSQVAPYTINGGFNPGRGFSFGINKDIPSDESSRMGYNLDVDLGMDNIGVAPSIMYKVNNNTHFSGALSIDLKGALQ